MIKTDPLFSQFVSPDCSRLQFIKSYLSSRNVQTSILELNGKNHIFVNFPHQHYDPTFQVKTLLAHYDRVPSTQGANDNSYAVFMLMKWAEKLSTLPYAHNTYIIFTDGEENPDGIQNQGAFALATWLKNNQILKNQFFVFDCMGRGDIPILCQTGLKINPEGAFAKNFKNLENIAASILSQSSNKWLSLPTAYSDNAGFIAAGIPAVTISMLPSKEADNYLKLLMKTNSDSLYKAFRPQNKEDIKALFPPTWLLINSPRDTIETLTDESEEIFNKIISNIVTRKTLS